MVAGLWSWLFARGSAAATKSGGAEVRRFADNSAQPSSLSGYEVILSFCFRPRGRSSNAAPQLQGWPAGWRGPGCLVRDGIEPSTSGLKVQTSHQQAHPTTCSHNDLVVRARAAWGRFEAASVPIVCQISCLEDAQTGTRFT